MNNRKKAFLLLWTYLILWFIPKSKNNKTNITYNNYYEKKANQIFATYNNSFIHIIPIEYADNITDESENIYIIDYRNSENPVMAINNSYKITTIKDMQNIIQILNEFEDRYPSNWDRTTKSMFNEWLIHNICYYLNIEKDRTKGVDFDNDEEIIYSNYLNIFEEFIKSTSVKDAKTKKLH